MFRDSRRLKLAVSKQAAEQIIYRGGSIYSGEIIYIVGETHMAFLHREAWNRKLYTDKA